MIKFAKRAIIVVTVSITLFIFTFPGLYVGGFIDNNIFNYYAVKTTCTIIESQVITDSCSYQCNCYQSCDDEDDEESCHQICQTCWEPCYDGDVTYQYQDQNRNVYTITFQEIYGASTSSSVSYYLDSNYPIGSNDTCYYDSRNPTTVVFQLKDPWGFYYAALVMAGICVGIILIWLFVEAIKVIIQNKDLIKDFMIQQKDQYCCNV